jgi:hypothetical protein
MKKQIIVAPEKGWEDHTWYLVEVAYHKNNPVHRDLFYSGFIDKINKIPSDCNFLPGYGYLRRIEDTYYLKVIRKVVSADELDSKCSIFMPPVISITTQG